MKKIIITIGRQFGSGGREVGKRVAELLGIKYYDKELIELVSRESGMATEYLESSDETASVSFSEGMIVPHGGFISNFYTFSDSANAENVFVHKMNVIKDIAAKESAVIVGRCADYILREDENMLSIFVHCNDMEKRIQRVSERHPELEGKNIEGYIKKADKKRASYYNFYTENKWGSANTYHLTVDTGRFGIEGTARFIASAVADAWKDK